MKRSARFWIFMAVFQVVFGVVVFAAARQYYLHGPDQASAQPAITGHPSIAFPGDSTRTDLATSLALPPNLSVANDPLEVARVADEYFGNGQYTEAAHLYEQLLAAGFADANIHNNLGITLHYLARSAEALSILNEGVAVDPTYQRIWLTLGFVNGQVGNTEQSRSALTTAVQMGADNDIGKSAAAMLENLP